MDFGVLLICTRVRACVCAAVNMTDSRSDWAELWPIERERASVQLIEFMSKYFLSCHLSSGELNCIHLMHPSRSKSWISLNSAPHGGVDTGPDQIFDK